MTNLEVFDLGGDAQPCAELVRPADWPPADPDPYPTGADSHPGRAANSTRHGAEPGRLVWTGSLLLLVAILLSLLALNGTAWTSTRHGRTEVAIAAHDDFDGNSVVTGTELRPAIFVFRLEAFGRYTYAVTQSDSTGALTDAQITASPSGVGPRLGLGYLVGAIGLALALVAVIGALRWPRIVPLARNAPLIASAGFAGITVTEIIGILDGRRMAQYRLPPTGTAGNAHFAVGNAFVLGLIACAAAIAGAAVLYSASRNGPVEPARAGSVTATSGASDT